MCNTISQTIARGLSRTLSVSIVGASGYSGAEVMKILGRHSGVHIAGLYAGASAGISLSEVHPWHKQYKGMSYQEFSPGKVAGSDAVFLALPAGEAMKIVPELHPDQIVIDLSGDLRLTDKAEYEAYYSHPHAGTELTSRAAYGLPEWNKAAIGSSKLVANPGCYATSAILALAPLLKEGLIESNDIVINSMSGVSGAGRKASIDLSFAEVNETVKAYRIGDHQHIPEIRNALEQATGVRTSFVFVPHLMPITRGIYTTITANATSLLDTETVAEAFSKHYDHQPFVRWHRTAVPEIRNVIHTNHCDIGYRIVEGGKKIVIMSAIDNLVKGAAGQAVQNLNIMCGFDEKESLI